MSRALQILASERIIAFRPSLRRAGIGKTVQGCLLASQIMYHHGLRETPDGKWTWICVSDEQLSAETALTVDQIRQARADLKDCGFFLFERKGVPAKMHVLCDINKIESALECLLRTQETPSVDVAIPTPVPSGGEGHPKQEREPPRTSSGSIPNKNGSSPEQERDPSRTSICLELLEENMISKGGAAVEGEDRQAEPFPVPESLKTLEAKIRAFWTEHKSRASKKTPQAWNLQMGWLLKILEDPSGGLKEVEAQLDKAEAAAVLTNKPWMAIRYDNWSAFGKKNNNQPAKGNARPGSTYSRGANPGHTQRIVQKPLEECIDYGKLYRERKNKANQSSPQT